MRVTETAEAAEVVQLVRGRRDGSLVFTLGNGCCDSTAAFLFEDHETRPDSIVVGEVAGVDVLAPPWLAEQYAEDEFVLDVVRDPLADALSIETDLGYRFVLLLPGQDPPSCAPEPAVAGSPAAAEAPHPPRTPALPSIDVPAAYRGIRLR